MAESLRFETSATATIFHSNYEALRICPRSWPPGRRLPLPPATAISWVAWRRQALTACERRYASTPPAVLTSSRSWPAAARSRPAPGQESPQFSADELRAAVEEAHRCGLPITAHAHSTQAIANAVAAGVDGMEHVSFWSADGIDEPGELIDSIVRQGIVVGATIGTAPLADTVLPPAIAMRLPRIIANTRRLYEAGATITAATDAGIAPGQAS